jgi:DNA-binding CsgD family transcriptional regulator
MRTRGRSRSTARPVLTARQVEVIGLVARGYTNKQIAAALEITERGVSAQVSRLCAKLGVPNRTGLIGRVLADAGFGLAKPDRPTLNRIGIQAHINFDSGQEFDVYRHVPFLVTVTEGDDHRYIFVNDAAQRVAGVSLERMIGRPARDGFKRGDQWLGVWDRAFRSGRPTHLDAMPSRWTADDGSSREGVFSFVFQPLVRKDGTIYGLLHVGAVVES